MVRTPARDLVAVAAGLAEAAREDEVVERALETAVAAGCDLAALVLESETGWTAHGRLAGAPLASPLAVRLERAAAQWALPAGRPGALLGIPLRGQLRRC